MIDFLIDSSAVWRILREPATRLRWAAAIADGFVGSCEPQRLEVLCSARNESELDAMSAMFAHNYPDVPAPKTAWRWSDSALHRLSSVGAARALSVVDLLICATAAHHGLTILHDDNDFATAARHLPDVRALRIAT